MGHGISNLASGVGQSFLYRREGVGHAFFINHISKCSSPLPPYTFWPVPKLCLHWASSPDIRRTCFSNLSLLLDCFARFSSIYPKEETLLKYLNRIICAKLCRAGKRLLYRIHAFMKYHKLQHTTYTPLAVCPSSSPQGRFPRKCP